MCFTVQLSRLLPLSRQLVYLITSFSFCQELFSSFFKIFFEVLPSRWRLWHLIMFSVFCQHLFSIFWKLFWIVCLFNTIHPTAILIYHSIQQMSTKHFDYFLQFTTRIIIYFYYKAHFSLSFYYIIPLSYFLLLLKNIRNQRKKIRSPHRTPYFLTSSLRFLKQPLSS